MALILRLSQVIRLTVSDCQTFKISKTGFHSLWGSAAGLQSSKRLLNICQSKRNLVSMLRKPSKRDLKVKDNVPDEYALIYRNAMSNYITATHIVIVFTTTLVIFALSLNPDLDTYNAQFNQWSKVQKNTENESVVYITVFVALILAIQLLIARSPLRIYKKPLAAEYVLVCPGMYPFSVKRIVFQRCNFTQARVSGIFPWRENRYTISRKMSDKEVILLEQYFRRPADLAILLGQQRDPELK